MKDTDLFKKIKKATKNPANIHYISWMTKIPEEILKPVIKRLLDDGYLIESHYAKDYWLWFDEEKFGKTE